MRIQSGKLDRKLELLAAVTSTDEMGQEVASFTSVATLHAQRLEMRTTDAARAGGRETFAMARYLIRYRPGITTAHRVRIEGTLFDVLGIEPLGRREGLILTLEEATR